MADPVAALTLKPLVIDAICSVYDPEIPVNIWELGLVYDVEIDAERHVHIRMTLTAPACPSAQSLPIEVEQKVRQVPGVADVYVEVVWEPAWSTDRMSDAAKLQLGMF
jgi:FeS assembly SUF system protein